jgi:hypothetical protein
MPFNYDQIPEELKWTAQWCVAGSNEKGQYKVPKHVTGMGLRNADPTNPSCWSDFESVKDYTEAHAPHGMGFCITAADPYVCIDLDIKNVHNEPDQSKWTTKAELDRYHAIVMAFHSYTERSGGGQGYHIWLRGHTGKGARRGGVEVYSQERFMVCTGDVVIDVPIAENQDLLDSLLGEMRKGEAPVLTLVDNEQKEEDTVLLDRAAHADNADKFIGLWHGDWHAMGYPSQSEADIALLTMLCFYSKSNTQVLRMFRMSGLGRREKAVKNDYYLGTTLKKVRSIEAHEQASSQVGENMAKALFLRLAGEQARANGPRPPLQVVPNGPQVPNGPPASPQQPPQGASVPPIQPPKLHAPHLPPLQATQSIEYPPGFVGVIAKHIYNTSPRPIREVAIVSALGLFAGLCGKSFCIPQSGLNLYIILVGDSAIGKEAMHSGISGIIRKLSLSYPTCTKYVDFADYVSAPALTKAIAAQPSFVNVSGEFGRKLQRMASEDRGDNVMQQLRTVMTNLYQKSGPGSVFGGLGYSDKDKNVASVSGVAYSMIGETTPETFYDALTDSMMADGFLSRFTIVEYTGNRPRHNKELRHEIDDAMVAQLGALVQAAEQQDSASATPTLVEPTAEVIAFLDTFDIKCDDEINSTRNQGWRQMWNRAHLKVYRISALLAAADNHLFPTISIEHVRWAYDLVMRDINIMTRRMNSGEVGISDATRENKILALAKGYLTAELAASYGIPEAMQKDGVVPRKYLQVNTQRIASFTQHKLGQTAAMDMTIRSLIDGGYLTEVSKVDTIQKYSFHGKCYRILSVSLTNSESRDLNQPRQTISGN